MALSWLAVGAGLLLLGFALRVPNATLAKEQNQKARHLVLIAAIGLLFSMLGLIPGIGQGYGVLFAGTLLLFAGSALVAYRAFRVQMKSPGTRPQAGDKWWC